jgi:deoxyribodipyrimidine photo-lyase
MDVGIVVFTRDLRVHDNPTLWRAVHEHEVVLPVFCLDQAILRSGFNSPNRAAFLADCLADLDAGLRIRGARLVVRRGRMATEIGALARSLDAAAVHIAGDVSGYSARRRSELQAALDCNLVVHQDALFAVPPGRIVPTSGGDHMQVFAAYYRRWSSERRRDLLPAPRAIHMPPVAGGRLPARREICAGPITASLPVGGERSARLELRRWLRRDASRYLESHDDLAGDRTSRLSPYLHFGCLSPVDLASRADAPEPFLRQVAWRDFHAQVLAARPSSTSADYRPRGDRWRHAPGEFEAWRRGRTGLPVVDAGMRQLAAEGWMHNRARLIVAHFLTKTLYLDWRLGARHFAELLVDADVANNTMNWQWVAGTGTDSRFNRTYNITAQALRHDPTGDYVRRFVPELRWIEGPAVHQPWALPVDRRATLDYPEPIVGVAAGNTRFTQARGKR